MSGGDTPGDHTDGELPSAWRGQVESLLASMLNGFALHEILCDDDGTPYDYRFLYVNPAFEQAVGRDAKSIVGKTLLEVMPDMEPWWIERYGKVATTGEGVHFEGFAGPLGKHFEVLAFCPKPGQFAAVFTDVTERVRQGEALHQSRERYRALVEALPDGVAVCDMEGKWEAANQRYASIHGYESVDQLKASVPTALELVAPHDRQRASDIALRVIESGSSASGEYDVVRRDGTTFRADVNSVLVRDDAGAPRAFISTTRDMTARHEAEREARLTKTSLDSSPDAVYWTGPRGELIFANDRACDALGYSHSELLELSLADIDANLPLEQLRELCAALGECGSQRLESMHRRRDGTTFPVEVSVHPVLFDGEEYHCWNARDLSARKEAEEAKLALEEKLWRTQKTEALGRLAGGVAHEFNNLLTGVLANATLALELGGKPEEVREALRAIESSAERAAALSRQMLAYSGRGAFVVRPVDMSEVVTDSRALAEATISKSVSVDYDLASGLPRVDADANEMRHLVVNLIVNAAESHGTGAGLVRVGVDLTQRTASSSWNPWTEREVPAGPYVRLTVSDGGCGMDEGTRDKMFEPFFTTKFMGRGLGLAAVLGIVKGHKGVIEVESDQGVGTKVSILLPATGREIRRSTPLPSSEGRPAQGVILVVDDEPTVRLVAEQALRWGGYEVLVAKDGDEAVAVIEREGREVDAVLLDLSMPGKGGHATFVELRRLRPHIPVILSSGYGREEATERFDSADLSGFLQKPYKFRTLVEKVDAVLGRSRK